METALLKSKSKEDLVLLLKLASKLNIDAKLLTKDQLEDMGMAHAIRAGRTGKHIDKDKFINKLQSI